MGNREAGRSQSSNVTILPMGQTVLDVRKHSDRQRTHAQRVSEGKDQKFIAHSGSSGGKFSVKLTPKLCPGLSNWMTLARASHVKNKHVYSVTGRASG